MRKTLGKGGSRHPTDKKEKMTLSDAWQKEVLGEDGGPWGEFVMFE